MTFDFDSDSDSDSVISDLHPEDIENAAFALPVGDQFLELNSLTPSAEQDAFDAIDNHFGTPSLDNWWENEE